ncbi:MAG: VWA domain-containing protein [Steroidobacteraceae bacterium]
MALAREKELTGATQDPQLLKAVDYLISYQLPDGGMNPEGADQEPPIIQGPFMLNGNSLVAMTWAAAHSKDPRYRQATDRALAWVNTHDPQMTQDEIAKVITLMDYGNADQKRTAWSVVERLVTEQQSDGGWKESAQMDGSNAFATGQVLYAFKRAGISVSSPTFQRGVQFLLKTQQGDPATDNFWKPVHSQSHRPSNFAPTMWAVIGLAGSYGKEPVGALRVNKEGSNAARNLEIVLDVSGSMKTALGTSTRWDTALAVLKDVVGTLPDDLNVGLRVYGHRYPSKSAQTCSDTELVVPLAKLDRNHIIETANTFHPRGETPLIRSVEATVGDLKRAGGGSVILITDGEESCHGDPKAAAAKIKASGVKVSLNIVGFTLTGKAVEAQLGALAGSTGGRYYSAQDGAQLSRALKLAALQRLPYDVLDGKGHVIASGETSELSRELPAGQYQVRMIVLGEELRAPTAIVANETTALALDVEGDRVLLRQRR